jgi:Zn finger protein HypA/HybF involved in hydrogenase expression
MSDQVQCGSCCEVKDKKEVQDNGHRCPECGGKEFRPT